MDSMITYTTRVVVPADRKITVELPEEMPLGEAEVTVCAEPAKKGMDDLRAIAWLQRERREHPRTWTPRTREAIDEEINAMRDEWDADPSACV